MSRYTLFLSLMKNTSYSYTSYFLLGFKSTAVVSTCQKLEHQEFLFRLCTLWKIESHSMARNTPTLLRQIRRQEGGDRILQGDPQTPKSKRERHFFRF